MAVFLSLDHQSDETVHCEIALILINVSKKTCMLMCAPPPTHRVEQEAVTLTENTF